MTLGQFSGNGTFTGTGTGNPAKLFIPDKDKMDPATATMARILEQFINSLNAVSGFTPYASLTGPGETTSPGDLTQSGGFTVNSSDGITLNSVTTGGITLSDNSPSGIKILETGTGIIEIAANTTAFMVANVVYIYTPLARVIIQVTGEIDLQDNGNGVQVGNMAGSKVAFFGTTPIAQQSGAGITTVAQLVTVLRNYGLLS